MGKELGVRISEQLKARGMQQKELAERIGLTEATLSRYKPDVIANMATALHTTSDHLLGIERDDFDYPRIRRMIARNASTMSDQDKKDLINALFGGE